MTCSNDNTSGTNNTSSTNTRTDSNNPTYSIRLGAHHLAGGYLQASHLFWGIYNDSTNQPIQQFHGLATSSDGEVQGVGLRLTTL